jgi:hypothetical protein
MLATETTQIVTRLNLVGLLPVRDPAAVKVWHEDVGHLDYGTAVQAARWLEHNRDSTAFGQVKPADLLRAVGRVRAERIHALLGNAPTPAPPSELDDDPAAGVRWQQAWIAAAGDGASMPLATEAADRALDVVRQPEALTARPTTAIVAQVAAALRSPGTRERHIPAEESA